MNPYEELGLNYNASDSEIKKAYRKLAVKHHPDKGGDEDKFKKISNAYEILSNKDKRNQYDNTGSLESSFINPTDIFNHFFNHSFNDPFNDVKHERGVVSMARAASPHSANSQFFICFSDQPHLDGQYTAFGKVLKGMEVIDNVKRGALGSGSVESPDVIEKAYVLSDA